MANEESINEFVSQSALKQLDELKTKIDAAAKSMEGLIADTVKYNAEISGAGGLKAFNDSVSKAKPAVDALEAATAKLNKALSEEAQQVAVINAQIAAANKANRDNAQAILNQGSAYDKLVRDTKEAEKAFLELAAAEGILSKSATDAQNKHKALFSELTKIQQGAGNFRQSVGNYASGFQSFSQVLREAPAFAVNAQTGLLALSNNLPILADELKRARDAGASFGTIIKGLGTTILSFGGIITILTTVLTFLPQIIKALGEETDSAGKKIKNFTEVQTEAAKASQKERIELEALLQVAQDEGKSKSERAAAIKKINDIMPDYLGNITEENLKTGEGAKIIDVYVQSLNKRALATAYITKLQDLNNRLIDVQNSELEDNIGFWDKFGTAFTAAFITGDDARKAVQAKEIKNRQDNADAVNEEIKALQLKFSEDLKSGNAQLDLDKIAKENNKTTKETIKLVKELTGLTSVSSKALDQKNALTKPVVDFTNLTKAQNKIRLTDAANAAEQRKKDEEELTAFLIANAHALTDTLFSINSANIDREKNEIQKQIELSEELKNAEIDRITASTASEEEKAARIAVINAKAQADRERLEARQRELDKKKAIADKQKAIFDTIINTALAVVKALPNIPLAIATGVLGAVQLATILAQPIPAFAKGTNYSPEGMAYVGERGQEMIVTPSGQRMLTPGTATLTYLERGSKVIPNHKLNGLALDGLAGVSRFTPKESNDFLVLAKATNESADRITKAIKSQQGTIITEGGLYQQHLKAAKLANYLKRNLK